MLACHRIAGSSSAHGGPSVRGGGCARLGVGEPLMRRILITLPLADSTVERLRSAFPACDIQVWNDGAPAFARTPSTIPAEIARTVEVLFTFRSIPKPEDVPALRWIQLNTAGGERLLGGPLMERGVAVTTASGIHAIPMAEYVFAMVLAWCRRLPEMLACQGRAAWPSAAERERLFTPREIYGQTLGVVGYGSIGRHVARLAKAFGMRVLAMRRGGDRTGRAFAAPGTGDPDGTLPDRYVELESLHELLRESDVVLDALPLTAQTRKFFGREAFAAMRPNAIFVNIGRGATCDEAALADALRGRRIEAALLDVFAEEPLPSSSPLWGLPGVIISPHVAGWAPSYNERAAEIFAENLRRYAAGEALLNRIDPARGY
ncbi:D-2-hydroxyacid dehydrogenase [bacterium]|nr:MAG: D-2-hydroxyacid dehydrogenase [bacterium]